MFASSVTGLHCSEMTPDRIQDITTRMLTWNPVANRGVMMDLFSLLKIGIMALKISLTASRTSTVSLICLSKQSNCLEAGVGRMNIVMDEMLAFNSLLVNKITTHCNNAVEEGIDVDKYYFN